MQSGNEIWSVNRIYPHKFFHEKSYAKSGGETIPSPFYKKSKLNIYLDMPN